MNRRQSDANLPFVRASHRRPHRGAAVLLLVAGLLGMIGFAAKTLVISEVRLRSDDARRARIESLQSAIEAVQGLPESDFQEPIRLAVDAGGPDQTGPVLELKLNREKTRIIAVWKQGDGSVTTVSRPWSQSKTKESR